LRADSNKTTINSIYENNLSQNQSINNQSENRYYNDDLILSNNNFDSSRKVVNFNSTKEEKNEYGFKNTHSLEDIKNVEFRRAQSPKRIFRKKMSKLIPKSTTLFFTAQPKSTVIGREHKKSFTNKKQHNYSNSENFLNQPHSGRVSKEEDPFDNDSYLQYRRRRPTTKNVLNFTTRNISYNYECLFFRKYENQIRPFKHECIICFSGRLIEYIYLKKEQSNYIEDNNGLDKFKIDILMTLLKDRVRIFYSMSPEQKTFLIKIFRKYLNKKVCMVGISSSDIEALDLSNIGIMVGSPKNYNTLFCHYYLCDKSLLEIEKIFKNGRSFYENCSCLFSVNSIYVLLSVILILFTYKLNTSIQSIKYIPLTTSIFFLCLSAFSIEPNYSVDINNLAMNNSLFRIYSIIKIIGTALIKIIGQIIIWKKYQDNEINSVEINNEIFTTYLYIFIWAQITSIILAFNSQSFFRKNVLNNIFFWLIFLFIFEYLIINLTLSDMSIENYAKYLFVSTNNIGENGDAFEDNHKILILIIFIIDIISNFLFIRFLGILFERYANKTAEK
jgi:hypothetical protein